MGEFRASVDALKGALAASDASADELLWGMYFLAETYEAAGNPGGALKIYRRIVDQREDFGQGAAQNKVSALESALGMN